MKIYVRGLLIDADKEPVMIVFTDDRELKAHTGNMRMMLEDYPQKESKRVYAVFPDHFSEQQKKDISSMMDKLSK